MTDKCARCGIKWSHGNDQTYVPQKDRAKSPRKGSWSYTGWQANDYWGDSTWSEGWQQGNQQPRGSARGSTPRPKTPKQKQKKNHKSGQQQQQYSAPQPDPPWHSQYRGDATASQTAGEEGQEASENLVLLATALAESNISVPAKVQHIVSENSAPVPTAKGLKSAVDKMDRARKKLKEAQKARANLHSNWRKYLADSVKRWTQFAEQFAKDDQELAAKVKTAQEKLQETKVDVDTKKTALEELEEDTLVEVTDDEMPDKTDTTENIQANIHTMVSSLQELHQKAEAAILEAGENKNKRPRLEAPGEAAGGEGSSGLQSQAMQPFGKPGK